MEFNGKINQQYLQKILLNFNIPMLEYEFNIISNGLINKSYGVSRLGSPTKNYFLQQIDNSIFKDIPGLMKNIELISVHFDSLVNPPKRLITLPSSNGRNFLKTEKSEYWRLYHYIEGKTYQKAKDVSMAEEAGKLLGNFIYSLSDLDASTLAVTLPKFHDINFRYDQFQESVQSATKERVKKATHLIKLIRKNIQQIFEIYQELLSTCPLRISHNDTKLSNLLFDSMDKGLCVIDYDTLMPGFVPFDFGDSVRTLCSTTEEDDTNLSATYFDLAIFNAFATNFINSFEGNITSQELDMFNKSVIYMPFIMGLRMLTDYLNNDIYYTVNYDHHNLDRAANQLTLFKSGVNLLPEMNTLINTLK